MKAVLTPPSDSTSLEGLRHNRFNEAKRGNDPRRLIGKGKDQAYCDLPYELIATIPVGVCLAVDGFCEWGVFAIPGTEDSYDPQRLWWRKAEGSSFVPRQGFQGDFTPVLQYGTP